MEISANLYKFAYLGERMNFLFQTKKKIKGLKLFLILRFPKFEPK